VFLTNVLKREDGPAVFWKERFIAGLPKLFGERILSKLRQNFATNDIPFNLLTFGQLFGIVKSEDLNLCNELKLQAKYGADKAHARNEMGNFREALGIEKIEAPSTKRTCIIKRKGPSKRPFKPRPKPSPNPTSTKPKPKSKASKKAAKKPIVYFKCSKPGHKAFQCKTEQKISELFAEDAQMKAKLLSVLLQEATDKSEAENDYYYESTESEYESLPLPVINVITTTKSQKEFLLDSIGQIPDGELKKEYSPSLSSNCTLIFGKSSITNLRQKYPCKYLFTNFNKIFCVFLSFRSCLFWYQSQYCSE